MLWCSGVYATLLRVKADVKSKGIYTSKLTHQKARFNPSQEAYPWKKLKA